MKNTLIFCFIIFFSIGMMPLSYSQVAGKYLISSGKVGPFRSGQKLSEIKKLPNVKKATVQWADIEGNSIPVDYYYLVESDGSKIEFWGLETVDYFVIYSSKYKTSKGIGVGSTLEEFAQKYPKYYIMDNEKGYYFQNDDLFNIEMIFSKSAKIGKESYKVSDFKKYTKIESIIVY